MPLLAGIKIGYGTYHVTPSIEHEAHLYMECSYTRDDDFEVDLTGVFFYFTVCCTPPESLPSILWSAPLCGHDLPHFIVHQGFPSRF